MEFKELSLNKELLKALSESGFNEPTPIQEIAIPKIQQNKDIIAIANTGTGKTLSFALPILNYILENPKPIKEGNPRCVILAPTRELATQIGQDIDSLSKHTKIKNIVLFGGVNPLIQLENLKQKYEIIIATPKRLIDLITEKVITLENIEYFIIDEADKVIKANKRVDLKNIIRKLPKKRQSLFFSATFEKEVEDIAFELLTNPEKIEIKEKEVDINKIEQYILYVKEENKNKLLLELLQRKEVKSAIIFTNSKTVADNIVRLLTANNIKSEALHSSKSNTHREKVIGHIKTKHIKYLIATDLASRGLDIDNITHIINYDIPTKPETYIHRIGRTGRLNNTGVAYTFCLAKEKLFLNKIESLTKKPIQTQRHTFHSELARNATEKYASNSQTKSAKNKKSNKPKFTKKKIKPKSRD